MTGARESAFARAQRLINEADIAWSQHASGLDTDPFNKIKAALDAINSLSDSTQKDQLMGFRKQLEEKLLPEAKRSGPRPK